MKIFIAGIMQGSLVEKSIHRQDYREELKKLLADRFPGAEIYDPYEKNKNSLYYGVETGRETFMRHNNMCGQEIDLLVAFVPEASMGTAIEMWEAYKNGATVITISEMTRNWAVKFLSHAIYPNLESFSEAIKTLAWPLPATAQKG
ncbi:MAG: hypothetical protein Q4G68_01400 [Planctomycetia bacterium]|nr:hypothetical protein [Planctomycetia bacterium]